MGNKEHVKIFHTPITNAYTDNYDKIFGKKDKKPQPKVEKKDEPEKPKTESKLTKQQEDLLKFKQGTLTSKTEEN